MCTTLLAFLSALLVFASAQTQCDTPGVIDSLCDSAPEGDLCVTPTQAGTDPDLGNVCGCLQDADCFNNPAYPYCRKTTAAGEGTRINVCDGCTILVTSNPATNNADHQFCRNRFPSVYLINPPEGFRDATERVSTTGPTFPSSTYFREMCNRNGNNGGSCEPCWQASRVNTPDIADEYVAYTGYSAIQTRLGNGGIHCRHVYDGTGTVEARPICSYFAGFNAQGWGELVRTTEVDLDIARNAMGTTEETRVVAAWEGACVPCVLGGEARHGMCLVVDSEAPICSEDGCNACASNAECAQGDTADCGPDATCTGGANCMASGACRDCTNDADCAANDGGAGARNLVCEVASGLCVDPTPCSDNDECDAGTNCMISGACRACTSNSDCLTNDGGSDQNQPTCDNGVCRFCAANADCTGTVAPNGGANCQANGRCANCGNSVRGGNVCGVADGGEVTGQVVCNTNTQICETACTSNAFCTAKGGSDLFTRGLNCQADGTCRTCTSDGTCGSLDGGDVPNQPTCDNGVCIIPFECDTNADCEDPENIGGGQNCQADQQCVNCNVGYDNSNCGALDGGEVPGQINCNQASRLCVAACTSNTGCVGTQGANCMSNGLCLNCRNDADCRTGNAWNGDLGAQIVCNTGTGICETACDSNADCPANTNCNNDGRCVACTTDAGCAANDGPPGRGSNEICRNGVCIDPYTCVPDSEDNDNCLAETGEANCQADGTCLTCQDNDDCGVLDGGQTPGQPRCQADGTCGPCTANADCPDNAPNCGADGSCYDCETFAAGDQCGARDGGEVENQPNCDTRTGICVDYCTADDQCTDDCAPHCNLDRGCCVECTDDSHCPLQNWSGEEADRTECSADSVCVFEGECDHDDDCEEGACSVTERKCVECIFDSHCDGETPACATGLQECVECVYDSHCDDGESCGSDNECHDGDDSEDAAGVLSFLSATLFVVFASVLRF